MSTLKVDTLLNAAGNQSPISVPGAAKAWVNFNGTGTVAIRDSYNISSITDNGTGDYTLSFTNNMANGNYAVAGAARFGDYINSTVMRVVSMAGLGTLAQTMSASSVRVSTNYSNGGVEDVQVVCVVVFGG
jgi:hypothetical protein